MIAEYQTNVKGVEPGFAQIKNGFKNANTKENSSSVFDLYKSDVTIAKIVFNIRKKKVVHSVNIFVVFWFKTIESAPIMALPSQIRYLHARITR
jgi:hypothetical protein